MNGIATLREWYPWPERKPILEPDCDGWFCGENQTVLKRLLSPATRIVVELGSWQGMSSRFIAEAAPNAVVVCVDHWLGSTEHHLVPEWRSRLPTLFDTFLSNLWEFRTRVIPMRTTSLNALRELAELRVRPDLIYIDAAHDEESVYRDACAALQFPAAWLVGDDATWETVEAGYRRAVRELNDRMPDVASRVEVIADGPCWSLPPRIAL